MRDAILGPGEYTCRRISVAGAWDGVAFAKGVFSKRHAIKSLVMAKVEANIGLSDMASGWDELHVGHQLVAVDGKSVDHLSSSELARLLLDATELTLLNEKRGQLERELMLSVRGSVHFTSAVELHERMQRAVNLLLTNKLDMAFVLLSEIPPGADVLVSVLKAELQFVRALVSQDALCTQKAIEDAAKAVAIAAQFTELPQRSIARKLCCDAALAEAYALTGIAHLLQHDVNPAVTALRKSLTLYTSLRHALTTASARLPRSTYTDLLGRARFGLGVFHLFSAVVPSEFQWILQLLQVRVDIPEGIKALHAAWSTPNLRAPWAGLALMNASPALLQHRLRTKSTATSTASKTAALAWTDDELSSSSASPASSDDEGDAYTATMHWHDPNVQQKTLERVEAECLRRHPTWVVYLWSASVAAQWQDPSRALVLAVRAETAVGAKERKYQLQLHNGHLSFRVLAIERATSYFQTIITQHARTKAMAPTQTQLDACVHLAACIGLDDPVAVKTMRSLLRHALFLKKEPIDDDLALLLDRAAYYERLPDAHLPLLAFDLLFLTSDKRPTGSETAQTWMTRTCPAVASRPASRIALETDVAMWSVDHCLETPDDVHLQLDAWTLYGLLLLQDPLTRSDALQCFASVVALSNIWPDIPTPCVAAAAFYLAKDLVHVALPSALEVLRHGASYYGGEKQGRLLTAMYQRRIKMLESVLRHRSSSAAAR
ncbi:hypothetical protein SPRG_02886 [Saprolegnia parasitica CBS 223.65]|uniref:Uncharacterized protein n=1 Tax=Saprolegnia parasitica (strain CBS 223.65) TaxID=695850 RepID=A0A067CNX3_SAPPC|nr:hypothetical protein SPRG_02886 [Saprolegnia parasitica CBS 223.65]KDO32409.1 hypothetical protein SPRG_02886 [Saprolegnia parasitica CBS 223.65]|eukprot:XP_012196863.1 hypothetical protein SPRG_02886 [Saprolegnia parasitica CBS 223.65]